MKPERLVTGLRAREWESRDLNLDSLASESVPNTVLDAALLLILMFGIPNSPNKEK